MTRSNSSELLCVLGECFTKTTSPANIVGMANTCELPDRKIPRHNREDRPKGQIGDIRIDRPCGSGFVRHNLRSVLGVPIRFMRALLNLGLSLGEDLSHLCCDILLELCLVFSQGVPEVRKELGSFVNRELAKRLKALVGPRDDFLCLRRCEVRECFDLLTSRRVYSCKSCLIHVCSLSLLVINDRVRTEARGRWTSAYRSKRNSLDPRREGLGPVSRGPPFLV